MENLVVPAKSKIIDVTPRYRFQAMFIEPLFYRIFENTTI